MPALGTCRSTPTRRRSHRLPPGRPDDQVDRCLQLLELPRDDGPNKTEINFFESDDFKTVGKPTSEGEVHNEYDPNFEMELTFYSNQVTFLQKIEPLIEWRYLLGLIILSLSIEWFLRKYNGLI